MSKSAEFYEQMQVFGLREGTVPPPGSVSLQNAYSGGQTIALLDGKPIDITAAGLIAWNVDSGSQKLYSDYNAEIRGGITSHLLNQAITTSLTVIQNQMDRVNINSTANAYVYTMPVGDTFPSGSQFELLQVGVGGSITLVFPTGVFLNGAQNTSFVLNLPYQGAIIRRLASSQYIVAFTQGAASPPGGIFTPIVGGSTNLSSVTPLYGRYSGNKSTVGGIITVVSKLLVMATDASSICKLTLTTPLPSVFSAQQAAQICGLPSFVVNTGTESIGNTGAGWNKDLFANPSGSTIDFWFEVAQSAVQYILDVSYSYEIQ